MTESVIHIKSPQLIGFSCVIPTWEKKEYCSFHSNRESAEEWVGVGWQSGSEVEQEIRRGKTEFETEALPEVRVELRRRRKESVNAEMDKDRQPVVFISLSCTHSFIRQPCFPGGGANTPAA